MEYREVSRTRSTTATEQPPDIAAAARNAVLNTTELLENILICLPPRNIIQTQRISQHFKRVIENSPAAQKLLYPTAKTSDKRWGVTRGRPSGSRYVLRGKGDVYIRDHRVLSLNTIICALQPTKTHLKSAAAILDGDRVVFRSPHMLQGLLHHMRGQSQSHLGMYLTNPPSTNVEVFFKIQISDVITISSPNISVSDSTDVTVGDIFDVVLGRQQPYFVLLGPPNRNGGPVRIEYEEPGLARYGSILSRGPVAIPKAVMFPYERTVSEVIKGYEEEHKAQARVTGLSIKLPNAVFATKEEIEAIEADPFFTGN